MTYEQMMGRRNEVLKRNISRYIMKNNRKGLSGQEFGVYKHMLKELHQSEQELKASRNHE